MASMMKLLARWGPPTRCPLPLTRVYALTFMFLQRLLFVAKGNFPKGFRLELEASRKGTEGGEPHWSSGATLALSLVHSGSQVPYL